MGKLPIRPIRGGFSGAKIAVDKLMSGHIGPAREGCWVEQLSLGVGLRVVMAEGRF